MKQTLFLLVATGTVVMLPLTQIKATDIVGVSNLSVPVPERHETMQKALVSSDYGRNGDADRR
ncbi:hypothetical protein [Rhizobium sullae]|uniref:hypothetical protein n=1 Tax=Rhizobium sullae TaxID=50338 RepID=UPI00117BC03D|nr:hypothetical protein [Rhizobium sullae]